MAVDAVVREWHPEQGWGVIDTPETPGGCWAHFSHVAVAVYRELLPSQAVTLEWERAEQDGFSYRAVRVWPADADPVEQVADHNSSAYRSTLTLHLDDETDR